MGDGIFAVLSREVYTRIFLFWFTEYNEDIRELRLFSIQSRLFNGMKIFNLGTTVIGPRGDDRVHSES